ncbi:hypothetical protein [Azospirillum sp. TSO35-2]|uniref:hypothetical protein n=1 Tax=Azospirillum sp. TSO35-2 TaxID=716796 RepID=UPI000D64A83D|nr:hypothetical protein [Azospirillum sp. TSO35-2]
MQITGYPASLYGQTSTAQTLSRRNDTATGESASATGTTSATDAYLAEAKKTPAQRLRDDWLARHKLTEDELNSMPSEKRDAINKEIAEELKRKLTGQDARRGATVDLTA